MCSSCETRQQNLTKPQMAIVVLAALVSDLITICTFNFFVPRWGRAALLRFEKNNAR